MSDQEAFERILASLYDAMLDDVHWPATSALIDEACGLTGNGIMVGEGPKDDIRALFVGLYYRGQRHEDLEREYLEVYHPIDERVPRVRQLPDSRLVHVTELYTAEELKTSPTYNEALPRAQHQNGLTVRLGGPDDASHISWGLGDPVASDGWGSSEIAMIKKLEQFSICCIVRNEDFLAIQAQDGEDVFRRFEAEAFGSARPGRGELGGTGVAVWGEQPVGMENFLAETTNGTDGASSAAAGSAEPGDRDGGEAVEKKSLRAQEQDTPENRQRRPAWREQVSQLNPQRLVFLYESGVTTQMTRRYGRAPRGERIREATPAGHWNTLTLWGAMTQQGMLASMTVESPTDGDVSSGLSRQSALPADAGGPSGGDGQPQRAQGGGRAGADRSGGSHPAVPAAVFARLQPH